MQIILDKWCGVSLNILDGHIIRCRKKSFTLGFKEPDQQCENYVLYLTLLMHSSTRDIAEHTV